MVLAIIKVSTIEGRHLCEVDRGNKMDTTRQSRNEQREYIRDRIKNTNLEDRKLFVIPAESAKPLNDEKIEKRVCAYCRVSTDDPAQTTSYELQKKHYEEQINNTPGWIFSGIYADEGISATSLKNRDEFNRMISDCYEGKIDVIVTKNVSRFARNVVDCLSVVRKLAQLNPPVGVKFETEGFFSLDNTSEMILTVLAAAAQEESKTKSNSMIWSLEQRFDNGNFLTPVLLGFDHDQNGNLIINKEEATTVKLMYYSFLAGFTLKEIAEILMELKCPTKKGNLSWTASSVRSILKNERYCGNVLSWKTYTYDFWEHKKRKNNKNRKQVLEVDHHEAIVSHEIYDAAQIKLQYDKFSKKGKPFPALNVVDRGVLKGFVSVDRTWRGFSTEDYLGASESAYQIDGKKSQEEITPSNMFKLDGFEVVRSEFFSTRDKPQMTFDNNRISFNTICMNKFRDVEYVEMLFNAVEKCLAIRPCEKESPNAIQWGRKKDKHWIATKRTISGFAGALYSLLEWDINKKYKLCGQYKSDGKNQYLLFDLTQPTIISTVPKPAVYGNTVETENSDHRNDSDLNTKKETVDLAAQTDDISQNESVPPVYSVVISYPDGWDNRFGDFYYEKYKNSIERIPLSDDWEILRPATTYQIAENVIHKDVLKKIEAELQSLLKEMGCAV